MTCWYQVIVLVSNVLVYFLLLQNVYVSLYNVYLLNLLEKKKIKN